MTSYNSAVPRNAVPPRNVTYPSHPLSAPSGPIGTFAPGTKVQVGNHRVVVVKYLSEGGFAHVYVVQLPSPVDGTSQAVLKRVVAPDKDTLGNMRTEVETMKKLKGHRHVVRYIDSHASQLKGGGYEVFLLMEYCTGGGLIDFMNTRLQNRLTEPEILKIFSDVAEGVACMHYLRPPLLHRDLKVENVLISSDGSSRTYKICDFGSAAPPRPAATTAAEGRLIEDDIQRHTTLQYRSPEMIDVYRKQPIDEKSDIWALGVFLYKLCYYTTPFEEAGQMAILNASFKYPAYPVFSDRLKLLIAGMLRENPQKRPTIYQVVRDVCLMRNKDVPIRDIYAERTQSEVRRNQQLPQPAADMKSSPAAGAYHAPPEQKQIVPEIEIAPMRRGRPTKPTEHHPPAKPSPSPLRIINSDPFAALDGPRGAGNTDELSNRFPTLDQFSLLHDKGSKFDFDSAPESRAKAGDNELSQRVTNALADEVFAKANPPATKSQLSSMPSDSRTEALALEKKRTLESQSEPSRSQPQLAQPVPQKPAMVSIGTMTGEETAPISRRPIQRFPPADERRPSSQPRSSEGTSKRLDSIPGKRGSLLGRAQFDNIPPSPASSRPSLEGSRPSAMEMSALTRSKSANARSRPNSAYSLRGRDSMDVSSDLEVQAKNHHHHPHLGHQAHHHHQHHELSTSAPDETMDTTALSSDMDFLRAKEDESSSRKRDKRLSSGSRHGHSKRSSMPSMALAGTKSLLAGRFGDAFRKFENNSGDQRSRSPSPERNRLTGDQILTPITGSEATERSDDGHFDPTEAEAVTPEVRREMERRRLSQEEKRVADAAADYRRRLAEKDAGGPRTGKGEGSAKAVAIQNKVQSLLQQDSDKQAPRKTAEGYGHYTDRENSTAPTRNFESKQSSVQMDKSLGRANTVATSGGLRKVLSEGQRDPTKAKPQRQDFSASSQPSAIIPGRQQQQQQQQQQQPQQQFIPPSSSTMPIPAQQTARLPSRPLAPPKPQSLRPSETGPAMRSSPGQSNINIQSSTSHHHQSVPAVLPSISSRDSTTTVAESEDWEANFSKRYPSLNNFEMVETEITGTIGGGRGPASRKASVEATTAGSGKKKEGGVRVREV